MSGTKNHIRREGNHFNFSSSQNRSEQAERLTLVQPIAPKRVKRSIWSSIGSFFNILFSGIVMILGFLIATPFFLLSVLWNWLIMFIGLSIFWGLVVVIYYGMILNHEMNTELAFNNTSLPILILVALIGAILSTIGQIRE